MDTSLFKNAAEKAQHENAVRSLCEQSPDYCDLIRTSYEEQLKKLLPEAHIRTFLPIFISRQVRQNLQQH
jgi:hypothetical protein